jgi:hypothetical protein
MAAELLALIGSGTIHVIDILILTKDADGTGRIPIQAIIASIEADNAPASGGD